MRQTVKELDQLFGTRDLEVYRHSPRGLFTESPLLMPHFHDRTCPACGTRISTRPFETKRLRRPTTGFRKIESVTVEAKGYFLYYRPRGSERVLPTEVRFVHSYCLDRIFIDKLETVTMGPAWVSQVPGVRV